ncbi:helix-turn-helix transcriptional regulator [Halosimplex marinum]|uniref:helix-turn-helix transcriptional regulator n=1 Tax=Halosimplex marinum TaxID=3396620 RepID=UPI003F544F8A
MRDASRGAVVSVAVVLLCLSAVGPVVGAAGERGSPAPAGQGVAAQAQPPPAFQSAVDPDVVVMRAAVDGNGTAAWTVEFRVRLDDENTTAAFESVQADVRENASAFTSQFATGMARTVGSAENRTGREMALEGVRVDATTEQLPQEYGVLTYRFTWTNFAATDGERLRIGDSLSGLFLDRESSLVLSWPTDYGTESVTPDPDETGNGSATWRGPADFGSNEPRVVAAPAGGGLPTTALAALAVLLVAAVAGGGWLYRSRTGDGTEPGASDDGATGATAVAESADDDAGEAADDSEGADGGSDEPPEELLSNEERVIRLVKDNGGRIKQQRIASEFDWTDAKTSQVVGTLREEDAVETFRIGRENVVALPEESDL